jgi:heme-degrading monooxygenase HmoA
MSIKDDRQPAATTLAPATDTAALADQLPVVDMFARIERFNLPQGLVELAEQLIDKIAPIMRRQAGFRSLTLLSDETSGEYILLTHWDTLEHINTFERSADEWRVRDIMSEHITAVPQIEVFQVHNVTHLAEATTA